MIYIFVFILYYLRFATNLLLTWLASTQNKHTRVRDYFLLKIQKIGGNNEDYKNALKLFGFGIILQCTCWLVVVLAHGLRASAQHPRHTIRRTREGHSSRGEQEEGEEVTHGPLQPAWLLADAQEPVLVHAVLHQVGQEPQDGHERHDREGEVDDELAVDELEVFVREVEFGAHGVVRPFSEHAAPLGHFCPGPP